MAIARKNSIKKNKKPGRKTRVVIRRGGSRKIRQKGGAADAPATEGGGGTAHQLQLAIQQISREVEGEDPTETTESMITACVQKLKHFITNLTKIGIAPPGTTSKRVITVEGMSVFHVINYLNMHGPEIMNKELEMGKGRGSLFTTDLLNCYAKLLEYRAASPEARLEMMDKQVGPEQITLIDFYNSLKIAALTIQAGNSIGNILRSAWESISSTCFSAREMGVKKAQGLCESIKSASATYVLKNVIGGILSLDIIKSIVSGSHSFLTELGIPLVDYLRIILVGAGGFAYTGILTVSKLALSNPYISMLTLAGVTAYYLNNKLYAKGQAHFMEEDFRHKVYSCFELMSNVKAKAGQLVTEAQESIDKRDALVEMYLKFCKGEPVTIPGYLTPELTEELIRINRRNISDGAKFKASYEEISRHTTERTNICLRVGVLLFESFGLIARKQEEAVGLACNVIVKNVTEASEANRMQQRFVEQAELEKTVGDEHKAKQFLQNLALMLHSEKTRKLFYLERNEREIEFLETADFMDDLRRDARREDRGGDEDEEKKMLEDYTPRQIKDMSVINLFRIIKAEKSRSYSAGGSGYGGGGYGGGGHQRTGGARKVRGTRKNLRIKSRNSNKNKNKKRVSKKRKSRK